jgi:hypothetical protein
VVREVATSATATSLVAGGRFGVSVIDFNILTKGGGRKSGSKDDRQSLLHCGGSLSYQVV